MESFAQCLQRDHTSKCKQDQSGLIQFELTCTVNVDHSAPNWPRLDRHALVVWVDLERSLTWCECMASQAEIESVHIVWACCRVCLSTMRIAALAFQWVASCCLLVPTSKSARKVLHICSSLCHLSTNHYSTCISYRVCYTLHST